MRSFFNRIFLFILTVLVLGCLFITLLPSILSSDWGKTKLELWINHRIPGSVEIGKVRLHWWDDQIIEGFILKDLSGDSIISFEKLTSNAGIWQFIKENTHLGSTHIRDLNATITTDLTGQSNLQKALGLKQIAQATFPPSTISLSDVQGDFYFPPDKNTPFTAFLKGATREGNLIGSFEIDLILNELYGSDWSTWNEKARRIFSIEGSKEAKIQAQIINFPVHLIDQFIALKGIKQIDLLSFVGEKFSLTVSKNPDPNGFAFNFNMLSPLIETSLKGIIDHNQFTLTTPGFLKLTIQPYALTGLLKSDKWILNQSCEVQIKINQLIIPLNNPEEGQLAAHISSTELQLKEFPLLAPIQWDGTITTEKLSKLVNFEVLMKSNDPFSLSLKGILIDFLDANKKLKKIDQLQVELLLKADKLPAEFFQATHLLDLSQIEKFKALWGNIINAEANIQFKNLAGPLKVKIEGNNGKAFIKGHLAQGMLKLDEPLVWSIRVTPLLSKSVLSKNAPFLSTMISAEQPIQLTIEPEGFACPLFPFDLTKVAISKGTIDAGKVQFLNQGDLNGLLSSITPVNESTLTIWFTPIFFNMQQGDLHLKRFDMLVASLYTMAGWGKMDLKAHHFDLVLGLTAQSLNQAFGIQGLKEDYILQVPLKDKKGHIEIDKTKMIGQVSALLAQMKGGNRGNILGSLLERAVSDGKDPTPPSPTTTPFPWAKEWKPKPRESAKSPPNDSQTEESSEDSANKNDAGNKSTKKKKKNKTKDKIDSFLQLLDKI